MLDNKCPVYVINLKRDFERREHMIDILGKKKIEFSFVTGIELKEQEMQDYLDETLSKKICSRVLTKGEVGCALSHLKIYKKMVDSNIAKAIIFEDDISDINNFSSVLEEVQEVSPRGWEIILLGYGDGIYGNIKNKQRICHYKVRESNSCKLLISKPLTIVHGAYAYLISLHGAKNILSRINLKTRLYQPIDCYTGNYKLIDVYCAIPACVNNHSIFLTSIGNERDKVATLSFRWLKLKIININKATLWLAYKYKYLESIPKHTWLKVIYKIRS